MSDILFTYKTASLFFVAIIVRDFCVLVEDAQTHSSDKLRAELPASLTAKLSQGMSPTEHKTPGSKVGGKNT